MSFRIPDSEPGVERKEKASRVTQTVRVIVFFDILSVLSMKRVMKTSTRALAQALMYSQSSGR
ncbi:hypothetical protein ES703_70083 [subsurface metagenome]